MPAVELPNLPHQLLLWGSAVPISLLAGWSLLAWLPAGRPTASNLPGAWLSVAVSLLLGDLLLATQGAVGAALFPNAPLGTLAWIGPWVLLLVARVLTLPAGMIPGRDPLPLESPYGLLDWVLPVALLVAALWHPGDLTLDSSLLLGATAWVVRETAQLARRAPVYCVFGGWLVFALGLVLTALDAGYGAGMSAAALASFGATAWYRRANPRGAILSPLALALGCLLNPLAGLGGLCAWLLVKPRTWRPVLVCLLLGLGLTSIGLGAAPHTASPSPSAIGEYILLGVCCAVMLSHGYWPTRRTHTPTVRPTDSRIGIASGVAAPDREALWMAATCALAALLGTVSRTVPAVPGLTLFVPHLLPVLCLLGLLLFAPAERKRT